MENDILRQYILCFPVDISIHLSLFNAKWNKSYTH